MHLLKIMRRYFLLYLFVITGFLIAANEIFPKQTSYLVNIEASLKKEISSEQQELVKELAASTPFKSSVSKNLLSIDVPIEAVESGISGQKLRVVATSKVLPNEELYSQVEQQIKKSFNDGFTATKKEITKKITNFSDFSTADSNLANYIQNNYPDFRPLLEEKEVLQIQRDLLTQVYIKIGSSDESLNKLISQYLLKKSQHDESQASNLSDANYLYLFLDTNQKNVLGDWSISTTKASTQNLTYLVGSFVFGFIFATALSLGLDISNRIKLEDNVSLEKIHQ